MLLASHYTQYWLKDGVNGWVCCFVRRLQRDLGEVTVGNRSKRKVEIATTEISKYY